MLGKLLTGRMKPSILCSLTPTTPFLPSKRHLITQISCYIPSLTARTETFSHPTFPTVKVLMIWKSPLPWKKQGIASLTLQFAHHLWFSVLRGMLPLEMPQQHFTNTTQCKHTGRWELTIGISVSLLSGCTCWTTHEQGDEHYTQAEFATAGEKGFREETADCVYCTGETCGLISNPQRLCSSGYAVEVMQLCVVIR